MPNFPTLKLLSIDKLLIYEQQDNLQLRAFTQSVRASKVLRNPPIVLQLPDEFGNYMVLDGAAKIMTLKQIGYPHILTQIAEPDKTEVSLKSWNHIVWGESINSRFLEIIQGIEGVDLIHQPDMSTKPNLYSNNCIAIVQDISGDIYHLQARNADLARRVKILYEVVDSYKNRARFSRTSNFDIDSFIKEYHPLIGFVIFPNFHLNDLMRLSAQGYLLPNGITHFTISPRALHLNYSLRDLASSKSLEEKNAALEKWIKERVASKGVRYYTEPTFLFDE
jgi:hypothetical protein